MFNDQEFDIVLISHSTFEYIREKANLLGEIKRVTKKDGCAIIDGVQKFYIYYKNDFMHVREFFDMINETSPMAEYEYQDDEALIIHNCYPDRAFPTLFKKEISYEFGYTGLPDRPAVSYIYDPDRKIEPPLSEEESRLRLLKLLDEIISQEKALKAA